MRTALVLGGGGAGGWMFHTGVVRALERTLDWHPDLAAVVIGTSAGSSVAAGLRLGATTDEIAAELNRPPSEEDMAAYRRMMEGRTRHWKPLRPGLVRELLPGRKGAGVALSGILPQGHHPTWPLARIATGRAANGWPGGLLIAATNITDGSRTVFGRDESPASVADAIEASSAVPGLMEPKQIGDDLFVDGGAVSPTNADLALEARAEVVVVSSPMTRPGRRPLGALARRRLQEERLILAAAGSRLIVVEPPEGTDSMFRDYPRRDRGLGREIRQVGEVAATTALTAHGIRPGDLG